MRDHPAALPEKAKETTMAEDKQERAKAIEAALAQIDKQFGKGSIMRLGSRETIDIPAIPTGSLSLDAALGVGGVPRGRVIEIFGPESSGKTTLSLHVIAEAQRRGGMAAFVDAEHALDATYAAKLGVDTVWIASVPFSPIRMIEPLPNCLSICASAMSSAFSRSVLIDLPFEAVSGVGA